MSALNPIRSHYRIFGKLHTLPDQQHQYQPHISRLSNPYLHWAVHMRMLAVLIAGMHGMMDIVDKVELIESVVVHNNMFAVADSIDRSRKRRKRS